MEIVVHKIYEPGIVPHWAREKPPRVIELITPISVWVCFGPFSEPDRYHAADHPNAVSICRYASREVGEEVVNGVTNLLDKLRIRYEVREYPGD